MHSNDLPSFAIVRRPPSLEMQSCVIGSYRPTLRAREHASRLTEIAVSKAPEAAEEALATTDACVEGKSRARLPKGRGVEPRSVPPTSLLRDHSDALPFCL